MNLSAKRGEEVLLYPGRWTPCGRGTTAALAVTLGRLQLEVAMGINRQSRCIHTPQLRCSRRRGHEHRRNPMYQ